jgi:hypothetical protein
VQPTNSTIAGAAKLTGRVGKFSIGVLQAITTRENAQLTAGTGLPVTGRRQLSPRRATRSAARAASSPTNRGCRSP